MEFSRQYWSGLPLPSPGDPPNTGIEPGSPALKPDSSLHYQKYEHAFKAPQSHRILQESKQEPETSEQQAGTWRTSVGPGLCVCSLSAPAVASVTISLWPGWIPGSGLWICPCFYDNPVLLEPCLLAGCYIWIYPGNPTSWCHHLWGSSPFCQAQVCFPVPFNPS